MNIEFELQQILESFHMSGSRIDKRREMYGILKHTMQSLAESKKTIALYGAGWHTLNILYDFGDIISVSYIIEADESRISSRVRAYQIPIIEKYNEEYNIEAVIISHYELNDEYRRVLEASHCPEIIDLYEILKAYDLMPDTEYYNWYGTPYKWLIEIRTLYENLNEKEEKGNCLRLLIKEYLGVRDFYSAYQWIDRYIEEGYSGGQDLRALAEALRQLERRILACFDKREKRDIFWFWQDGTQHYLLDRMPFVSSLRDTGIFFEESYTPSAQTRSVYANTLDQTEELEMHKDRARFRSNHKLPALMREKGYRCFKVGRIDERLHNLEDVDYMDAPRLIVSNSSLTELYWNALRIALLSDDPVFLLLHSGIESHHPYVAPTLREYDQHGSGCSTKREIVSPEGHEKHIEVLNTTLRYVDDEYRWLQSLMGRNTIRIFMSDHGEVTRENSYLFTRDTSHTVLAISGDVKPMVVRRLFSLLRFSELILYLVNPQGDLEDELCQDELRIGGVDYYNIKWIRQLVEVGYERYGLAYDGYTTKTERYVLLGTGEELYSVREQDFENRIDNPECQERVEYWRKRHKEEGYRFLNIKEYPKFARSKELYDSLGKTRIVLDERG